MIDLRAQHETYATHGYSPDKEGYRCGFVIAGPGIRQGIRISSMEMADVTAIAAKVLDLEMEGLEGTIPEGMFQFDFS